METPQKFKQSRRQVTTAATDKNDTIYITVEDEKRSRIKTESHKGLTLIKAKLNFKTEKQELYASKTKNQAKIQANYRKNMLDYLNQKFAEANAHALASSLHQERKIETKLQVSKVKIIEKVAFAFQQFMHNARQQRALNRLTQYQLGSILQNMSFIKDLLSQRAIIVQLYNQLSQKSIKSLFMFIIHFYVIKSQYLEDETIKKLIIENVKKLFEVEGVTVPIFELQRHYDSGIKSSRNAAFKNMKLNRQRRHTLSSYYHSINRGKK